MNWLELSVHTSHEAIEAVSHILQESGANGTLIEDPEVLWRKWENRFGELIALRKEDYPEHGVVIKAYFPEKTDFESLLPRIQHRVQQLKQFGLDPDPAIVHTRMVDEESWADKWKAYYKPVRISDKLVIKPTWEEYEPVLLDEHIIELDPGMAFGTGTHPTTMLSLQLLEKYLFPNWRIIDVGCGSGILSIAAAKLGAKEVLALDLDPLAVEKSKENVCLNQVDQVVSVKQGNLLQGVTHTADCVVANILAEIIVQFTYDLPRVLVPGGIFISSGIIKEKEELVRKSIEQVGLQVLEVKYQEDWVAIAAKKW
ncbi:50S ribosomal protein L11 methyltransferase [Thermoflavimicrobium daqui]|uniref:Ribosomal protein L11 methyltransferase n=1 Tax=Thermoflavimicrobium daqui TaxID=2137476 RepID=A0A364K6B1_9BACL|nr:50S ribosomal protein L11 methyltransferase [Thermoflavimicrobium daqui]RAL25845.1 50S ribosomal protein L11 methyltransferase [Thermoflavimicrobium daqui]